MKFWLLNESSINRVFGYHAKKGYGVISAFRTFKVGNDYDEGLIMETMKQLGKQPTENMQENVSIINNHQNAKLHQKITAAGWNVIPTLGGFVDPDESLQENVSPQDRAQRIANRAEQRSQTSERSFFIPSNKGTNYTRTREMVEELFNFLLEMIQPIEQGGFDQWSFLWVPPAEEEIDPMMPKFPSGKAYFIDQSGNAADTFDSVMFGDLKEPYFSKLRGSKQSRFSFVQGRGIKIGDAANKFPLDSKKDLKESFLYVHARPDDSTIVKQLQQSKYGFYPLTVKAGDVIGKAEIPYLMEELEPTKIIIKIS